MRTRPLFRRLAVSCALYSLLASLAISASCSISTTDHPASKSSTAVDDFEPLPDPALAGQAYLGLSVRDDPATGGLEVVAISIGPLMGDGDKPGPLQPGDVILSINEEKRSTEAFITYMKTRARPGDTLKLKVRRPADPGNPPAGEPAKPPTEFETTIQADSRANWCSPIMFSSGRTAAWNADTILGLGPDPTAFEKFLAGKLDAASIRPPVDKLLTHLKDVQDKSARWNTLSRMWCAFAKPYRVVELEHVITGPMEHLPADPSNLPLQIAANLDARTPTPAPGIDLTRPPDLSLADLSTRIDAAAVAMEKAFAPPVPATAPARTSRLNLPVARDQILRLAEFAGDTGSKTIDHAGAQDLLHAMRLSLRVDFDQMVQASAELAGLMKPAGPCPASAATIPLPDELRGAVTGDILAAVKTPRGWLVYGGYGPNTYDMSYLAAVIDPAGDDTYNYPNGPRPLVQVIIDRAGNDRYIANPRTPVGPASAVCGISLLIDDAGDDTYEGGMISCGAAAMGIGILLDRHGNDTYTSTTWSQGSAMYGAGVLMDLGGGEDAYIAHVFSQGVGGPRGLGLLLDQQGRDFYRLNGPNKSVYGTPAVFAGFGQGLGFGIRPFDTGGIGILLDLGGDDRYEAGEFAQGVGYFYGMGILHDRNGNDLYFGNRYSQGASAHQAVGILVDDQGDDTYYGMTAASQGASWDESIGLLLDRAGNDAYAADGISQGSAAMQAVAMLIDEGGSDRFVARAPCHGESGGNSYHFAETGCFSFSLLLHNGEGKSWYSSGRAPGSTTSTGKENPKNPEDTTLHGLFIDDPALAPFWPTR